MHSRNGGSKATLLEALDIDLLSFIDLGTAPVMCHTVPILDDDGILHVVVISVRHEVSPVGGSSICAATVQRSGVTPRLCEKPHSDEPFVGCTASEHAAVWYSVRGDDTCICRDPTLSFH